MEKRRVIVGDGVGDERDGAAFAGGGRGVFAQKKPNLLLHIRVQRGFERAPGARGPLERGRETLEHGLENFHVAGLEGHGQQVGAGCRGRLEIRHQRQKELDRVQFACGHGVMQRASVRANRPGPLWPGVRLTRGSWRGCPAWRLPSAVWSRCRQQFQPKRPRPACAERLPIPLSARR